jgi:LCP family protein required for cell wall assembly
VEEPSSRPASGGDRPRSELVRRVVLVPLVLVLVPLGLWNAPLAPLWGPAGRLPSAAAAPHGLTTLELSEPPADAWQPRILLLVGNDSRASHPERRQRRYGHLAGERADSVALVELVPALRRLQVLSLPRDLRVPLAGLGDGKLGSALTYGGAPGLLEAVRRLTGLPVHHYVELDFSAVEVLVDAVGGVTVELPHPARDLVTGFRARRGSRRLDGAMAVAYARSRQYEELRAGVWTRRDASDLGRIRRQQRLLLALGREPHPPGLLGLARAWLRLGGHARFDGRLSFGEAWGLLGRMRSWPVDERNLRTLPTRPALDAASTVSPFPPFHLGTVPLLEPQEPAASAVLDAFRRGDLLAPAPDQPDQQGA